jgi:hypothetical protein
MKNVVDAFLQIGKFISQPINQPLCNLPQEHARFAGRVKKRRLAVTPDFGSISSI